MAKLWNWINEKDISTKLKPTIFLIINCLIFGALGLVAWMLVSRFALKTIDWAICFIGYPGFFIGFLGGYLFLCKKSNE